MRYFAYGSNMDPERMKERGIQFSKREHAILKGFRLEFNKITNRNTNEGKANIVDDDEKSLEGILYEIKDNDLEKLDKYEGCPKHYTKKDVNVILDNGKTVEAITYIAQPNMTRKGLKPTREYLIHLLRGCDLLSKEYCEMLKKVETLD
ncbi:MAG: gamma-glutamylcyclotransferase family protein [Candidatus Hadarchaeum sp.]|uniref:gamma-glutamylcyclotransferase family protein n=1 Tax=Candidatus Hadarchaeum sp. TaxID=2883567 RepID=UPI00317405B4